MSGVDGLQTGSTLTKKASHIRRERERERERERGGGGGGSCRVYLKQTAEIKATVHRGVTSIFEDGQFMSTSYAVCKGR